MRDLQTIALLTGGGDCPGLNAVIRAVVRTALGAGIRVKGVLNGFAGLVDNEMIDLGDRDVAGILPRGGTILGTTNRANPFEYYIKEGDQMVARDLSGQAVDHLRRAGVDALIVIGGDGSLAGAAGFSRLGVNVVAVPKTIDNDIAGTERTFGFDTAVTVASEALDRLHTTAEAHHRVMILEVMGRYAGWIGLHSGIAGGAECILLPEIPYRLDSVLKTVSDRQQSGKRFSLIVAAEGARPVGGEMTVQRLVEGSHERVRLGGVGEKIAREIEAASGIESRCVVLGHLQRGGSPTAYDRVLATRYGVAAVNALLDGKSNVMVALQDDHIVTVPISEVAGKMKQVPADGELVRFARAIGIHFGD